MTLAGYLTMGLSIGAVTLLFIVCCIRLVKKEK